MRGAWPGLSASSSSWEARSCGPRMPLPDRARDRGASSPTRSAPRHTQSWPTWKGGFAAAAGSTVTRSTYTRTRASISRMPSMNCLRGARRGYPKGRPSAALTKN
jgi:hypothetical protein